MPEEGCANNKASTAQRSEAWPCPGQRPALHINTATVGTGVEEGFGHWLRGAASTSPSTSGSNSFLFNS
eukprot:5008296-Lingulodinium_polyedra.AAC.1